MGGKDAGALEEGEGKMGSMDILHILISCQIYQLKVVSKARGIVSTSAAVMKSLKSRRQKI